MLERLAREFGNLRLEQAALDAYREVFPAENRFLAVALGALMGDRLSRLIRVFECSKDTASFWYLHRCDPRIAEKIDIERLRAFSSDIKDLRNATFTHIDKKYVSDPRKPYQDVTLKESEIVFAISAVWQVVSDLWVEQFGRPITQVDQAGLKGLLKEALSQLLRPA